MYQLDPTANQSSFVDPLIDEEKAGVKRFDMRIKEGDSVFFRILPAFSPDALQESPDGTTTAVDPLSWVPFRDPVSGGWFVWTRETFLVQGVGYGSWRDRESFILPKTFRHRTGSSTCAYSSLYYKAKNSADWKYLTEDQADEQGKRVSAVLPYPKQQFLTVVYEVGDPQKRGVHLTLLPKSASNAMFDEQGVCNALNVQWNNTMDPMLRWNCGDITNPENGIVLCMSRKRGADNRTLYHVTPAPSQDGMGIMRWPLSNDLLQKRPVLANDKIYKEKSNQEIVKILASRLTGVSPYGHQEYGLLRETFGDSYELPEPQTSTASSTFNAPAQMPAGPGAPQAPQAFPQQPQMPQAPQQQVPIPPPQMPQQPQTPPAATQGGFPTPPPQPGIPQQLSGELPQQPQAPIAGQPLQQAPTPPPTAQPGPDTHGAVPQMPQAPAVGQTPQQPQAPVPGQETNFNRDEFLRKISGEGEAG